MLVVFRTISILLLSAIIYILCNSCSDSNIKSTYFENQVPLLIGTILFDENPESYLFNYSVDMMLGNIQLSSKIPVTIEPFSRVRSYYIEYLEKNNEKVNKGFIKQDIKRNTWDYNRLIINKEKVQGTISYSYIDGIYLINKFHIGELKVSGLIDYNSKTSSFKFDNIIIGDNKLNGCLTFDSLNKYFIIEQATFNKYKIAGKIKTDGMFKLTFYIVSDKSLTVYETKILCTLFQLFIPIIIDFQYQVGGVDIASEDYYKYVHHQGVDSGCMGWTNNCNSSCYSSCSKSCSNYVKRGCEMGGCKSGCNEIQCTSIKSSRTFDNVLMSLNLPMITTTFFMICYFSWKGLIVRYLIFIYNRLIIMLYKMKK